MTPAYSSMSNVVFGLRSPLAFPARGTRSSYHRGQFPQMPGKGEISIWRMEPRQISTIATVYKHRERTWNLLTEFLFRTVPLHKDKSLGCTFVHFWMCQRRSAVLALCISQEGPSENKCKYLGIVTILLLKSLEMAGIQYMVICVLHNPLPYSKAATCMLSYVTFNCSQNRACVLCNLVFFLR